jgi:error-prone DNA polymerase
LARNDQRIKRTGPFAVIKCWVCAFWSWQCRLEISHADPLQHRLVFERFPHYGRQGTPDIDVDFASSRRQEVIEWISERFAGHTAMTANINTFGLRGAVRDTAKALGWSLEVVGEMTKVLSH